MRLRKVCPLDLLFTSMRLVLAKALEVQADRLSGPRPLVEKTELLVEDA